MPFLFTKPLIIQKKEFMEERGGVAILDHMKKWQGE
jgi:hypothetical protein